MQARKTARDLIADHLRRAILNEELEGGQKLSVGEIANELGVSHTPTREAFQLLAGEGFVKIHAFRGAHVAELSADEYQEIMLMRIALEGLAARLGAERIDEEGLARMTRWFEKMVEAADRDDPVEFIEVDREFHAAHYRASGRESLWDRIIGLRYTAERYTRRGYQTPGLTIQDTVVSHRRLLEAVQERDGERASLEISRDLEQTYQQIWTDLQKSEVADPVE